MATGISIDGPCAPQPSDAHRQAVAAEEASPIDLIGAVAGLAVEPPASDTLRIVPQAGENYDLKLGCFE